MDRINDIVDLRNELVNAENYLRYRRRFAEADAVRISRNLCISVASEYFDQLKKEGEGDAKR